MTAALLSSNGKKAHKSLYNCVKWKEKKWPRVTAQGQLEMDETVAPEDLELKKAGCRGSNKYLVGVDAGAIHSSLPQ